MAIISFLVSSASTQNGACAIGPYFNVYADDANCGGCFPAIGCWPCLTTAQQIFSDPAGTIPVGDGYYSNEYQSGVYATWYVIGGFPQPAGFNGCAVNPTPTPTSSITPSPTPTFTSTPTNTQTPTPTKTSTPGVSQTPTPNVTPTATPTNTNTPSVTPTISVTPSITPSNSPTPSITPSVSVSSLPITGINFKTIADSLQIMAARHKQINSYGLGDTDQMSYWTQIRLDEENTTFESPFFPLLYIVPSRVLNALRYKNWEFNLIMSDIVDRDLTNQVDVLSDTLQILQDVVSQYRLSVDEIFGCYNTKYYVDETVQFIPFLEKYSDLTNGWNGIMRINTMTPLDRCAAAYNVFTGTPIVHDSINFKTFHDDFRLLADHHKQLNSFGFGALEDLSYWTESRLKQDNPTFESPFFPLLYVVPGDASQIIEENGSSYTEFDFNCIVMDILDRDLINQVDVLSDTNQILDDIISQFRLSVTQSLGCFNAKYYLDDPVECQPFMEQYSDLCGGWSGRLRIKVMTPLDRCAAAFDSFLTPTPTVTPTVTPTNTQTPTQTPTITCPTTTQYLEVQLSDSAKFKLILWNQPNFTSPANALCDYIISGCAYGNLGTIYCATETINEGQHQHQFNLSPVLLPGEDVIAFDVLSYTASTCACPLNLILPVGPTPTPTVTQTMTPTQTTSQTPTQTATNTATPTNTPTNTATNTPTQTPSETPTNTPTNTQTSTQTPTNTSTSTSTPTPTPSSEAFQTEYVAILNRGTALGYTLPTNAQQRRQNQLVKDLKNYGLWTKLGTFYPFAQDVSDSNFTRINWITPANSPLTLFRNTTGDTFPTFTNTSGWTFNRTNALQFANPINVNNSTVNPITVSGGGTEGVWVMQQLSGSSSGTNTYFSTDNNGWNRILSNNSTAHWAFRGIGFTAAIDMSGLGFRSMSLSGNVSAVTTVELYTGTTQFTRTKTTTDTNIAGGSMLINGGGAITRFGWTCGLFFHGLPLTQTEMNNLHTAFQTYLDT